MALPPVLRDRLRLIHLAEADVALARRPTDTGKIARAVALKDVAHKDRPGKDCCTHNLLLLRRGLIDPHSPYDVGNEPQMARGL